MKAPRVAVLIGGTSKAYKMTRPITEKLAAQLRTLSAQAGLMITASRRTGVENERILQDALAGWMHSSGTAAVTTPISAFWPGRILFSLQPIAPPCFRKRRQLENRSI
ncbi:MAG: ELM1/GtrOC1 family putative glycosyltransferase [Alphaproteobacteria bacterium]